MNKPQVEITPENSDQESNDSDISEHIERENAPSPIKEEPKISLHRRISDATFTLNERMKNYKYILQTVLLIAALIAFILNSVFSKNSNPTMSQEQLSQVLFKAVENPMFQPLRSGSPVIIKPNQHQDTEGHD